MESQCNAADAPNAVQINNGISAMAAPFSLLLYFPPLPPCHTLSNPEEDTQAGSSTYLLGAPPLPPMPKPDTLLLAGDNGSLPLI